MSPVDGGGGRYTTPANRICPEKHVLTRIISNGYPVDLNTKITIELM